jgi:hypothetical protein
MTQRRRQILTLLAVSLAFGPGAPVAAQESTASPQTAPRIEVSAGYLNRSPAYTSDHGQGVAIDLDLNARRRFGFRAKVDGFNVAYWPRTQGDVHETGFDVAVWRFAFGPRFIQRWSRVTLFEHVLLTAHRSRWGARSITRAGVLVSQNGVHRSGGAGLGFGAGVDVRVDSRVAIRVVEVDAVGGLFGNTGGEGGSIQTGIVFRFGSIR